MSPELVLLLVSTKNRNLLTGRPRFTDLQSNRTNLISKEYETNTLGKKIGSGHNLVPIVFVPLDQRSENENSGSIHFRRARRAP